MTTIHGIEDAKAGYIYIMHVSSGSLKVGYSYDPQVRVKQLRNAACPDIAVLKTFKTIHMGKVERDIHKALKGSGLHQSGELYDYSLDKVTEVCEAVVTKYDGVCASYALVGVYNECYPWKQTDKTKNHGWNPARAGYV